MSQTHSAVPLSSIDFTKMTVPQLKEELKERGSKGILRKQTLAGKIIEEHY